MEKVTEATLHLEKVTEAMAKCNLSLEYLKVTEAMAKCNLKFSPIRKYFESSLDLGYFLGLLFLYSKQNYILPNVVLLQLLFPNVVLLKLT